MNRDELVLTAALTQVNEAIKRYILRVLDEATGHSTTDYTRSLGEVEHVIGVQMVKLGHQMQDRAAEHGFVVLDAEPPPPQLSDPARRKPDIPEF